MENPRSSSNMPYVTIVDEKGKIKSPAYTLLKDGREFAYAKTIADARLIKLACEDWWLTHPRKEDV